MYIWHYEVFAVVGASKEAHQRSKITQIEEN